MQKTNPYIFGATVSGKNFYGDERRRLIAEISAADNPVHAYAVFGLRRYGKSSFLKELAGTIAAQAPDDLCVSWNLAGCDAPDKALEALCSGLVDDKCEIKPVQVEASNSVVKALNLLIRATARCHCKLWLLCDECDSLRAFRQQFPSELARLRNPLLNNSHVRVIMVGARPLSELANTNGAEEPLLSGFQMHYLPPLSGDDIAQLVTCAGAEVGFVLNDRVALISQHTGGHPFLAQGLCLRLFDGSSWEQAYYAVISHASLQYAFKQDYQFLSEGERQVVHAVSAAGTLSEGGVFVALPRHLLTDRGRQQFLDGLTQSGYLVTEAGSYRLANTFFADWLKDSAATLSSLG